MEMLKSVVGAGAAAVFTVTFIHPIDVLKTRLQVSGDGSGGRNYKALGVTGTLRVIAAEEGVGAFWKGIGAAWMREASYTSLRLGLYGPIKTAMGLKKDSSFFLKFVAGGLAGALGSTVGNPFDVVKTRMMAAEGKAIPSMGSTFAELYKKQGLGGFYRGLEANVMRAVVLNGAQWGRGRGARVECAGAGHMGAGRAWWGIVLVRAGRACVGHRACGSSVCVAPFLFSARSPLSISHAPSLPPSLARPLARSGTKMACYDQIKGELIKAGIVKPKTVLADFVAAFGAGFFMTCTVAPFDKIRTRLVR